MKQSCSNGTKELAWPFSGCTVEVVACPLLGPACESLAVSAELEAAAAASLFSPSPSLQTGVLSVCLGKEATRFTLNAPITA